MEAGLPKLLGNIGWRVEQIPPIVIDSRENESVNDPKNVKNCFQVGHVSEIIQKEVMKQCIPNNFPLILGGDHCISIGTISAIKEKRKDTAVIWVLNTHSPVSASFKIWFALRLMLMATSIPPPLLDRATCTGCRSPFCWDWWTRQTPCLGLSGSSRVCRRRTWCTSV